MSDTDLIVFSIYPEFDLNGWRLDMIRDQHDTVTLTNLPQREVFSIIGETVFKEGYTVVQPGPDHCIVARFDPESYSTREVRDIAVITRADIAARGPLRD